MEPSQDVRGALWLAHSARKERGIPAQEYGAHIAAVAANTLAHLDQAGRFAVAAEAAQKLQIAGAWAGTFHDLGKLEDQNQAVLNSDRREPLRYPHEDAGALHCLQQRQRAAAWAIHSHHQGLTDAGCELAQYQRAMEGAPCLPLIREGQLEPTRELLAQLLVRHASCAAICYNLPNKPVEILRWVDKRGMQKDPHLSTFEMRLLLSALVDADHGDTAHHYREELGFTAPEPRWAERLEALKSYVGGLGRDAHGEPAPSRRDPLRRDVYSDCATCSTDVPIYACDAPVGSGKTTAIMAYLLRAALERKLRRIFIVLPFTNIINQSVDVYRKALVLPGEEADQVVAAHHHAAEFHSPDARGMTTLWRSPIVVTTAVQFFETLAASATPRLRKLHALPGSAVFVDEAHAAIPLHLWPSMWDRLECLSSYWGCRFVLGSGSLPRLWENARLFANRPVKAPPSMLRPKTAELGAQGEQERVVVRTNPECNTLDSLCRWIKSFTGARLVVMNTLQSAAALARQLDKEGIITLHLSTALTPADRDRVLARIRKLLTPGHKPREGWVLVATSCIEAGVDVSFEVAFRERSSIASLVQIGGRVNRHGGGRQAEVWDFTAGDALFSPNPALDSSRKVVAQAFQERRWSSNLSDLMTWAIQREWQEAGNDRKAAEPRDAELHWEFSTVAQLSRFIDDDSALAVVDRTLVRQLKQGEPVSHIQLTRGSVSMRRRVIEEIALQPLREEKQLYEWPEGLYDREFLGIMGHILDLRKVSIGKLAMV